MNAEQAQGAVVKRQELFRTKKQTKKKQRGSWGKP